MGGTKHVNKRTLLVLFGVATLMLVAASAWAHYSISRRVENWNITLSVIAVHSLEHDEDEGDTAIRLGEHEFELNVLDISRGYQPVDNAQIRLLFRMPDHDMGEPSIITEPQGQGSYVAQGTYLTMAGRWQLVAELSLPDRTDPVRAEFELTVEEPLPARAPSGPLGLGQSNTLILTVVGLVLALIVLTLAAFRWKRQRSKEA